MLLGVEATENPLWWAHSDGKLQKPYPYPSLCGKNWIKGVFTPIGPAPWQAVQVFATIAAVPPYLSFCATTFNPLILVYQTTLQVKQFPRQCLAYYASVGNYFSSVSKVKVVYVLRCWLRRGKGGGKTFGLYHRREQLRSSYFLTYSEFFIFFQKILPSLPFFFSICP